MVQLDEQATIDTTGEIGRTGSIRTPDQRLRVFISSTLGELAAERDAARTAVRTLRLAPVMFELGARPYAPQDLYRSYLEQSDIFVGIYWQSYGWVGPGQAVSGIHDEYLLSGDRPRLIYVKEPAPGREDQLRALLDDIREDNRASYKRFETPGELAELLLDDLAVLLTERFLDRAGTSAPVLPTGTLTFQISDLEDSTGLAHRLGDRYPDLLDRFADLVAETARSHSGQMLHMEEDRAVSVFGAPADAAAASTDLIARASRLAADGVSPRLRVGMHTGVARPTSHGYAGIDAHRATRIAAAGHGGQIVVSAATRALLDEEANRRGWSLRDLGSYALKGLSRSERLFQLEAPGLEHRFGPPRARSVSRVELPAQLTRLVGRSDEVARIARLLSADHIRLVTITGPGGIGKTRVGLAAADRLAPSYPDGVFFVNLAPVISADQVITAIGDAAGVALDGAPMEALAESFSHRSTLLVLDNFEQVVAAGIHIAELLGRCPGLNVLVTSREPLRVRGEHEYPIGPLPVPAADDPASIRESEAVQLFLDRAQAVHPDMDFSADELEAVAHITRLVDGVPLAIELAAARVRSLSPTDLAGRLTTSFDALGAGAADLPARQQTIRATIEWSHDLLDPQERALFRRLSVFTGQFDLAAAEQVASHPGDDVLAPDQVLGLLESLVDKSLVRPVEGVTRGLRMLIAIREYGRDRLQEAGEADEMADRHAAWVSAWAEAISPELSGAAQGRALEEVALRLPDVQTAIDRLLRRRRVAEVVHIMHGLWVFVWLTDRIGEVDGWLRAIRAIGEDLDTQTAARLDWMGTSVAFEQGDYETARRLVTRSLEEATDAGDTMTIAWARFLQAIITPAHDPDPGLVEERLSDAYSSFREIGDRFGEGFALVTFGILATAAGRIEEAIERHHQVLALAEEMGYPVLTGQGRTQLGFTYLAAGRLDEAREQLGLALEVFRQHRSQEGIAYVLEALAALAFREGRLHQGMVAMGAAEGVRRRYGISSWPSVAWFFEMLTTAADGMADQELQAARQAATAADPFEAAAIALTAGVLEVAA